MKRSTTLLVFVALALLLSACGAAPAETPAPAISADAASEVAQATPVVDVVTTDRPALDMSYDAALSQRLLLSLGTMELANTDYAVNEEQAAQMVFYWQALQSMTQSGNSATEEVAALLNQIEDTLTAEQIVALNAMQLTQEDMQLWAQANQVASGSGDGTGTGQGGGSGMSPEARATRQAEEGKTGSAGENGLSAAISKAVIEYLQSVQ